MDLTVENAQRLGAEVRDAYRRGQRPSALVRRTFVQVPSPLFAIMVFRAAFGLSIAQCKEAGTFLGRGGTADGMDDDGMDAYLRPLLEGLRSIWDAGEKEP